MISRGAMKQAITLSAFVISVSVSLAPSRADAPTEAQRLLAAGISHYANGEFHEAIALLNRAVSLAPDPALLARLHAYLGVNYFVTNQRDRAQEAFTRALQHDPAIKLNVKEVGASILRLFEATRSGYQGTLRVTSPRPGADLFLEDRRVGKAPWEQKLPIGVHRIRLETDDGKWHCSRQVVVRINSSTSASCTFRPHVGKLSLVTSPPGAVVLLEGRSLGKAPLSGVDLPVGEHRLRVRLGGYQERLVTVTVRRGSPATLQVELKKVPESPAARRRFKTLLAYTSLGVGLALLSGAAVFYGVGASEGDEAHDRYHEATIEKDYESSRKSIESARDKLVVGHVLAGVGLVAVGYSIYQFVSRPGEMAPAPRRRALSINPAPGGAVVTLGGRF